jgi:hypothetical protein
MRTIIDLPEDDLKAVKALAKRQRVSQAEVVRRAVHYYLARRPLDDDQTVFGLWAGRQDGLEYQKERRGEWDR